MEEIRIGSHVLQPNRQLLADGDHVHLGARALQILTVLAEAGGEIVTKDELFEAVWPGMVVEENALQAHIAAIRKALGDDAERLETMRGVGYKLETAPGEATAIPVAAIAEVVGVEPAVELSAGAAPLGRATLRKALPLVSVLLLLALLAWGATRMLGGDESLAETAVLVSPFEASDAASTEDAALARGITDELIARLRQVDGLRIGTAAAGDPVTSGPFGNAHTISGNVARNGERVRVTVRLQQPDGEILWTDSYERELTGLFEVQELVAASISDALSVSLNVGNNSRRYGGTDNPEAFAAYLQWRANSVHLDPAVPQGFLERAIELDPEYVMALAAMAQTMGLASVNAPDSTTAEPFIRRMDALSRQALDAAPELANAHIARGWYFVTINDLVAADRSFRRAAELDPGNNPEMGYQQAVFALVMGRAEEALAHQRAAELIDPIARYNPWLVSYLVYLDRPQEALDMFEDLSLDPDRNLQPHVWHVATGLLAHGREDEARLLLQRDGPPGFVDAINDIPTRELAALSERDLRAAYASNNQAQVASAAMVIAGYRGEPDLAVRLARIAYEKPGGYMLFVLWNPNLAQARSTAEFAQLMTDLGFVAAWRESDNWGDFCRPLSETEIACE